MRIKEINSFNFAENVLKVGQISVLMFYSKLCDQCPSYKEQYSKFADLASNFLESTRGGIASNFFSINLDSKENFLFVQEMSKCFRVASPPSLMVFHPKISFNENVHKNHQDYLGRLGPENDLQAKLSWLLYSMENLIDLQHKHDFATNSSEDKSENLKNNMIVQKEQEKEDSSEFKVKIKKDTEDENVPVQRDQEKDKVIKAVEEDSHSAQMTVPEQPEEHGAKVESE